VPSITRSERIGEATVGTDGLFVQANGLIGIALWVLLWAVFLPTGVLAWREPDALETEEGGRLSESLRDALLGLALAGALAVVAIADSDAGAWPFIATLALLGGLGRRAAGQPMMSRQRKIRVAIGIAMILVIVIALVAGLSGASTSSGTSTGTATTITQR
jgi:hypothetical protein